MAGGWCSTADSLALKYKEFRSVRKSDISSAYHRAHRSLTAGTGPCGAAVYGFGVRDAWIHSAHSGNIRFRHNFRASKMTDPRRSLPTVLRSFSHAVRLNCQSFFNRISLMGGGPKQGLRPFLVNGPMLRLPFLLMAHSSYSCRCGH